MSAKWRGMPGRITARAADAEPLDQQLFGPSYDLRMRQRRAHERQGRIDRATFEPWKKPRIERAKRG